MDETNKPEQTPNQPPTPPVGESLENKAPAPAPQPPAAAPAAAPDGTQAPDATKPAGKSKMWLIVVGVAAVIAVAYLLIA